MIVSDRGIDLSGVAELSNNTTSQSSAGVWSTSKPEDETEEVEYHMSAWTSGQRSAFTRRLDEADIPWFWRKRTLVIFSDDESTVDQMLDNPT